MIRRNRERLAHRSLAVLAATSLAAAAACGPSLQGPPPGGYRAPTSKECQDIGFLPPGERRSPNQELRVDRLQADCFRAHLATCADHCFESGWWSENIARSLFTLLRDEAALHQIRLVKIAQLEGTFDPRGRRANSPLPALWREAFDYAKANGLRDQMESFGERIALAALEGNNCNAAKEYALRPEIRNRVKECYAYQFTTAIRNLRESEDCNQTQLVRFMTAADAAGDDRADAYAEILALCEEGDRLRYAAPFVESRVSELGQDQRRKVYGHLAAMYERRSDLESALRSYDAAASSEDAARCAGVLARRLFEEGEETKAREVMESHGMAFDAGELHLEMLKKRFDTVASCSQNAQPGCQASGIFFYEWPTRACTSLFAGPGKPPQAKMRTIVDELVRERKTLAKIPAPKRPVSDEARKAYESRLAYVKALDAEVVDLANCQRTIARAVESRR